MSPQGFYECYARTFARVLSVAIMACGSQAEAEDAVQEGYLAVPDDDEPVDAMLMRTERWLRAAIEAEPETAEWIREQVARQPSTASGQLWQVLWGWLSGRAREGRRDG